MVISDIGSTNDTALICNTNHFGNLTSNPGGRNHSGGDWFAPDGTRVGDRYTYDVPGFVRERYPVMVHLLRNTASDAPSEGIYYCVVEDDTFTNQTVYVGLYNSGGGGMCTWIYLYLLCTTQPSISGDITISGGMTFTVDSDLNGASPQFTLTCFSTGGPATTVTWTRDSVTVTEGTETVLDNHMTAQYTQTLTVTGRLGGLYTCTVANHKPSKDSAQFTAEGIQDILIVDANTVSIYNFFPVASAPTNLVAVQEGPTNIRVSWSPPTPLGDTTGYRIYYSGGSSGSEDVSDGSTDNHLLIGLQNGYIYTISIVATSQHLPSESIKVMNIRLGKSIPLLYN